MQLLIMEQKKKKISTGIPPIQQKETILSWETSMSLLWGDHVINADIMGCLISNKRFYSEREATYLEQELNSSWITMKYS